MANLGGSFDASQVEPTSEYEALPEGKYHAEVVSSERRGVGQDGAKGEKLTLCWQIKTGPLEGRMVWQDLLLWYNVAGEKGDKTRDIAARQLSEICHAVDKLNIDDSEDLHHRACEISVGFQKQNINQQTGQPYPPRNEIKGVKPTGSAPQQRQASAPQANQPKPSQQGSAPSGGGWARRAS